jgi:hypothetical protein
MRNAAEKPSFDLLDQLIRFCVRGTSRRSGGLSDTGGTRSRLRPTYRMRLVPSSRLVRGGLGGCWMRTIQHPLNPWFHHAQVDGLSVSCDGEMGESGRGHLHSCVALVRCQIVEERVYILAHLAAHIA